MFDLPSAKRIGRDEILSPGSSRSPSPVPDETDMQDAHARLGKLLDLDGLIGADASQNNKNNNEPTQPADVNNDSEEEQEFEFRLFSAPVAPKGVETGKGPDKSTDEKETKPAATEGQPQKLRIRLRSPTPVPTEGRFVKAFRGWQYYVSTPSLLDPKSTEDADIIAEKQRQFEDVAVSGQHMLTWAKSQAWPGCDLPWRVIRLKRHQTKLPPASKDVPIYVVEDAPSSKSPVSRKKPGKKRRIQLRKRSAVTKAVRETEAEKRNRKNRERKIKRRQKAREQKAAGAAATGTQVDGDVSSQDGDS
ncbi:hypothetical protein N7474_003268 [Penicillium riverlandense]|uniref:uncharacterized protein n=1 Tax=Penicillium riverlandense TaxID=1903569 RepID=UPI0025470431|nr:uncharacterized protein N7474_003268 [Penicillium riverlandense]KAJ5826130.1 hypothetical protein N7474_003268 [Penicillium riverlandense]